MRFIVLLAALFVGPASGQIEWQAYVDGLVNPESVKKAAILDANGAINAKSHDFQITESEGEALAARFNDNKQDPIMLAGEEYNLVDHNGETIIANKDNKGFVAWKTAKKIVIGFMESDEEEWLTDLYPAMEIVAEHFKSIGI